MPKRTRRNFQPDIKAAIIRRQIVDKVPVSDLCDEYSIQPSLFYQWQSLVMGNLEAAFEPPKHSKDSKSRKLEHKIEKL